MVLHCLHRPCLALSRHVLRKSTARSLSSPWIQTAYFSSVSQTQLNVLIKNPRISVKHFKNAQHGALACSTVGPCRVTPSDKMTPTTLAEIPILNEDNVFSSENLKSMSPESVAGLASRLQTEVYECLYKNFEWLQPDRAYAFVQLAINGEMDEIFSPVITHEGFNRFLDEVGNRVHCFENENLIRVLTNLVVVGTDCTHPIVTKLIMRLYDIIPYMELRYLIDLNLISRYLPRNDFYMTKLLSNRITSVIDAYETEGLPLSPEDTTSLTVILAEIPFGLVSVKHMERYVLKILQSVEQHPSMLQDVGVICDLLRLSKRLFFGQGITLTTKRSCRQISTLCCSSLINQIDTLTAFEIYKCCKRNFRRDVFFGRKLVRKIRARGLELLPDVQRLSDLSNLSILFHQNTENDYEVKDRSINEEINALMCTKLHSMLSRTSYVDPLTLSNLAVNLIYFKPNDRDMTACLHKHIIARFDRLFNFMKCYYRISGFLRFHPFTEEEDQNKYHMMLVNHIDHSAKRDRMLFRHIFSLIFLRVENLSDEVLDKLISIIPNVGYSELASVASRVTLHTKKTFLKPQQKNRILKAIYDQIAADVNEVSDLDQLYFMARSLQTPPYTPDPTMNSIIMDRFADFSSEMTDICFLKVSTIFHANAFFHQKVYDDMANFVLCRKNNLSPAMVKKCLQTLAQVGYRPANFDKLASVCVEHIEQVWSEVGVLTIVQQVESLCELQHFPEQLLLHIFNIEFIDKVDKVLSDSKQKRIHAQLQNRLMNLNRMAVLECPEYDIPWFHEEYCKSLEREEPLQDVRKQEMMYLIQTGLHHVLGGPLYLTRWAVSPYYHDIDFEFALDKMSKPVEMKKLADLPESSYQRWAIQVLGEDDYCSNIRQLKNQKRMVAKHLDLLGYRVVQIPHFEWNSMALTEWPSKLEYLKSKVFGEAQDNIKSYKFN